MRENKSLIKSTRVISAATFASRMLGFVRDIIIARFFGTGVAIGAFIVAFRIPNLLRSIVGEGSTSAAVVPVLSRLDEQGQKEQFWEVANCLLNILVVLLAGLTLLGELFAPYLVRIIAPGFIADPAKLGLTIRLTRWILPYFFLIGLTAYAMAVLNSLRHFALPALAPCMLNISLIASILIFFPSLEEKTFGLVIGVLIGGLLQLAIQLPLLIKKGLFKTKGFQPARACRGWVHPEVKKMGRLFLPRTLGIAVYQANVFVDTIMATFAWIVGQGAVAALYYANRIVQLPLALFGIALAQVALPTMSGLAVKNDFKELRKTVAFSLRSVFTMMVPATLGIVVLAEPLIRIIFERGSFSSYSTEITSFVLLFYCLGLTGYAGIKILASCFYSLEDTVTPVKIASFALAINIILNLILMWPLKMGGLALATAISVTVNFTLLLSALRKKIGALEGVLPSLGRVILAAGIMATLLYCVFYRNAFLAGTGVLLAVKLGISILAAIAVYFLSLKAFAREEAKVFTEWILRRK